MKDLGEIKSVIERESLVMAKKLTRPRKKSKGLISKMGGLKYLKKTSVKKSKSVTSNLKIVTKKKPGRSFKNEQFYLDFGNKVG